MGAKDNPAACRMGHERVGLVSNQNPSDGWDKDEPLHVLSCCARPECVDKLQRKVAGSTNRRAEFYRDADRRAGITTPYDPSKETTDVEAP